MLSNTEEGPLSGAGSNHPMLALRDSEKHEETSGPGCVFFVVFAVSFGGKLQDVIQANRKTIGLALLAQRTNYAARLLCLVSSVFFVSPFVLSVTFDLFCRVSGRTSLP